MRNLKIAHRMILSSIVLLVPVAVLAWFYVDEKNNGIEFAEAELRGVQYHSVAFGAVKAMVEYRTALAGAAAGDQIYKDRLGSLQSSVDERLAALAEVDGKLGGEMKTSERLSAVKRDWDALKGRAPEMGVDEALQESTEIIRGLVRVIQKMGNHSNLILDPDIDTYYLMDATQFKLAILADQIGQQQAAGLAAIITRSRTDVPATDTVAGLAGLRAEVLTANTRVNATAEELRDNLEYAFEANGGVRASVGGLRDVTLQGYQETTQFAQKSFQANPSVDAATWLNQTSKGLDGTYQLFDSCLANLDTGLKARVERLGASRSRALALVGGAVLVAIGFLVVIIGSITRSLAELANAAERVSMGDLDAAIDVTAGDEVGDLAKRFHRMRESIRITMQSAGGVL